MNKLFWKKLTAWLLIISRESIIPYEEKLKIYEEIESRINPKNNFPIQAGFCVLLQCYIFNIKKKNYLSLDIDNITEKEILHLFPEIFISNPKIEYLPNVYWFSINDAGMKKRYEIIQRAIRLTQRWSPYLNNK